MCDKLVLTFRKDPAPSVLADPCKHDGCHISVIVLRRTRWMENRADRYARVSNVTDDLLEFTLTDIHDCDPTDFEFSFWAPTGYEYASAKLTGTYGCDIRMKGPIMNGVKYYLSPPFPLITGYRGRRVISPAEDLKLHGWREEHPRAPIPDSNSIETKICMADVARDIVNEELDCCDIDYTCLSYADVMRDFPTWRDWPVCAQLT